jgi:beta-glucanase (GH16 family)
MRAPLKTILAIICSLLLQACGGGGGGGGGGPSPQATNKAPTLSINAQIDVLEGTAAVATAAATDPESQTLTFSLSPSADRDLFDISASGVLRFLTAPDFETPADANDDNDYELSVTVSDSQNASDSQNVTVTVTNAIEGRVIDAPLSGSEIYIVTAGASAASAGDSVGTSDAQGYFFIPAPADTSNVQIMTRGGTDIETQVAMPDLMLMADLPNNADASIAVTPISTVVANADTAEDKQAVLTALGITGTVDAFLSKDIWKEAEEGDNTAQSLQSTNAQIGLLISTAQSLVEDGTMAQLSEVADKVAEKIAEKASAKEAIDLQADSMISEVLSDALSDMSVESTAIDAVSSNIAEINELLADEDIDPTSADAADFIEKAQTELQVAVKDLASGDTSVNDFVTETAMATLFSDTDLFKVQTDETKPVISISGSTTINHEQGQTYNDPGATANDAVDGVVTVTTDNQVEATAGTYSVIYSAQDRAGNVSTAERTVIVADTTDPTINLIGAASVNHLQGTTYIDAGATATDNIDGTLTPVLNGTVGTDAGVYTLSYTATDIAGNSATATRTVTVTSNIDSDSANIVIVNGTAGSIWDLGIQGFDERNNYSSCSNDGGSSCPSLNWAAVEDGERGNVLQVTYAANAQHAGVYFKSSTAQDLSAYASGNFVFDIKVIDAGTDNLSEGFYLKMESGNQNIEDVNIGQVANSAVVADGQWQTIIVPMSNFTNLSPIALDLSAVDVAMNLFPAYQTGENLVFQLDNARFELGEDNSNPTPINTDKWFHQTQLPNGSGWYNNELQHYTNRTENSYVSNGTLKIVAIKEAFTDQGHTKQYTSARLNSKYAFTYGRVEVRAKLPSGGGTWPAIWTLGQNISEPGAYWQTQGFGTTSWPACGEIDIMEHWGGNPNYVQSAMHTPSSHGGTVNKGGRAIPTATTNFHLYSMEWTENEIIFAVDGIEHYRYDPPVKNADTWPFDKAQYLLMNFAIEPSIVSSFNQGQMEVDYVRIYAPNAEPGALPAWSDEFND